MDNLPEVTNWFYICGACLLMPAFFIFTIIIFGKNKD